MYWLTIVMRLTHIVLGALWVGMMAYNTYYAMPALRDAGPDGAKVMMGLQRRRLMVVLPLIALGTILSGFWLMYQVSAGFQPAFMETPVGRSLGLGAGASLVAFVLGIAVGRPAMLRAMALAQALGSFQGEERAAKMAEVERLRNRGATASRWATGLVIFAAGAMAVARYL